MGDDILKTNVCGLNGKICSLDEYPGCDPYRMGPMSDLPMDDGVSATSVNEWVRTLDGVGGVCNAGGGLWKVYYTSEGQSIGQEEDAEAPKKRTPAKAPAQAPTLLDDEAEEEGPGLIDGLLDAVTDFAEDHGYKAAIALGGIAVAVFGAKWLRKMRADRAAKKAGAPEKSAAPEKTQDSPEVRTKSTDISYDIAEELRRIMHVHDQFRLRQAYRDILIDDKVDLVSAIANSRDLPDLSNHGILGYDFSSGMIYDDLAEIAVDGLGKVIIGGQFETRDVKRIRKEYLKICDQVHDILDSDAYIRKNGITPEELVEYTELWSRRLIIERHIIRSSNPAEWKRIEKTMGAGVLRRDPLPRTWVTHHLMEGGYRDAKDPSFDHAKTMSMRAPAPTPANGTPRPVMLEGPGGASEAYKGWFGTLEPQLRDLFLRFPKEMTDALEGQYNPLQLRVVEKSVRRWIPTLAPELVGEYGTFTDAGVRHLMKNTHQIMFGELPDEGAKLQSASERSGEKAAEGSEPKAGPEAKPEPDADASALTGEAAIILKQLHEEFKDSAFDFELLKEADKVAIAQGCHEFLEASKRNGTWRQYLEIDKETDRSRFKEGALRQILENCAKKQKGLLPKSALKAIRDERRGRGNTGKADRPGFFANFFARFKRHGK